jgi:multifunctional beta-oxidation protein
MSFKGKVAIVTGAGGGLGRCYALELAKRGCNIIINDIGDTSLVVQEIERLGTKAVANHCSVLEGNEIVKQAVTTFGSCDILINNAGILRDKSFHKMSKEDWKSVIDVHLNGSFELSYAAWPHMQEKRFGRIINIGL